MSLVTRLIITLLIIPLIIVMAVRSPQAVGHLIELIIIVGARLLNAVAAFATSLLGAH